jgi:thioester reductase-like protein
MGIAAVYDGDFKEIGTGSGSLERLQASQTAKGLPLLTLADKVACLDADLSQPYFSLSKHCYMVLLNQVSTVIHGAWQVDFNLSISLS